MYHGFQLFGFIALFLFTGAVYSANGITYHGKLMRPNNTPVNSVTTQFRIQIKSPGAESCLLWEEQQTKDLSNTNGIFTITINDTTEPSLIANILPFQIERVFSNRTGFTGLTCSAGTSYTPSSVVDGRVLQVFFREQPTDPWEQMPLTKINFVPQALNSVQLAGYQVTEFLKMDPASTQTALTASQVTTLLDLVTGNYLKAADATTGDLGGTYGATVVDGIRGVGVAATAPTLNQVLKYNGTQWAPANEGAAGDASYAAKGVVQFDTDAATSGITVAAGVVSLANTITAGGPTGNAQTIPVITYDAKGRLTTVATATIDDTTKLSLDGSDTMTGALNMGNQNITNTNTVSATGVGARTFTVFDADNSNYTTLQVPSVLAANYALTLPVDDGAAGQVLSTDGNGILNWVANGAGDVVGPASSTDNAILRFDGVTGKLVQNSSVIIDDSGNLGVGTGSPNAKLTVNGAATSRTNIVASGAIVDLSLSNLHMLKAPGSSTLLLQNIADGGTYTIYIMDTTVRTYTFSGCTNTYFSPANTGTSFRSAYTITAMVDGANTECMISWLTGFN